VHCSVYWSFFLSDEILGLLAVREWERVGMAITDISGNKTMVNLVLGMGIGINHCE